MKNFICVMMVVVSATGLFAQAPDSLWSRTFGGSNVDYCYDVRQTTDGGYVLAGFTDSFASGSYDFYLVKTNANGDSLWSRMFGGGSDDRCQAVQQTTDGDYVLAGRTDSFGAGSYDFYLVKTDANGNSLWSRTFGGSSFDYCYGVQQTLDGGYVLAGWTYSFGAGGNFWLVKTNADGDSMWSQTFGGDNSDACWSVQQTAEGGYILAGCTSSFGVYSWDFWLVKTDSNGDSLWSRTYGGGRRRTVLRCPADFGRRLCVGGIHDFLWRG